MSNAAVAIPKSTLQITYDDLYARWEKGNWRAMEIDFSQDRVDWHERMSPQQRRGALWLYSLFFHGEDSVADNLSPYIDAAPLEEQKYFLTTQQVDEARHTVFFKRFMEEVVGVGGGTAGAVLAATQDQLSWGHRQLFARLDETADALRADRSKVMLARAVTLYHIVVEASSAQPGQHMIESSLERLDLLPGFREGMANVALDEQRHIAFGVRLLADLLAEDPEPIRTAIIDEIREATLYTAGLAWPPGGDRSFTESFGFTLEELFAEGARAQDQRLKAIGLTEADLARLPFPTDIPYEERAQRGIALLQAGFIGEKTGPAAQDPEAIEALRDSVRRLADGDAAPAGTVIQWDHPDAEPWYLRLDNGATSVAAGRAASPDLTLHVGFQDWIDMSAGRVEARSLLLRRRLRPKGSLRLLARMPKIMGG